MNKFIVVRDTGPRSGKVTIYIAKLVEYDGYHGAVYEVWAKADTYHEAMQRVKELNAAKQVEEPLS